jgi:hypothetical protein
MPQIVMKHNKIIFLDIDGVIAVSRDSDLEKQLFLAGQYYPFTPECVEVLNRIIEKTNAEIVLSSTWRLTLNLAELDEIFKKNKVIKSPIDVTCNIAIDQRELEINNYLANNSIEKFVILDDLDIVGFGQRFVKIDDKTGITEIHIERIVKQLT